MAGNTQLQLEVGDNKDVTSFPSKLTDPWVRVSAPQKLWDQEEWECGQERREGPCLLPLPHPPGTCCCPGRSGVPVRGRVAFPPTLRP